jgi:hypothetical protein
MRPATDEDIEAVERRLEARRARVVMRYEDLKEGVDAVVSKAERSWPLLLLGGSLAAGIAMSRNTPHASVPMGHVAARTGSPASTWMGRIAAGLGLLATAVRIVTSSEARAVYGAYRGFRAGRGA